MVKEDNLETRKGMKCNRIEAKILKFHNLSGVIKANQKMQH